ncbi:MAG: hypothetical protein C0508_12145 [Cyanobacteria bacterium PR.023]|nr:hypothetical protein [Cyanobacteria bacterium PR.023]
MTDIGQNSTCEANSRTQFKKQKPAKQWFAGIARKPGKALTTWLKNKARNSRERKNKTVKTEFSRLLNQRQATK